MLISIKHGERMGVIMQVVRLLRLRWNIKTASRQIRLVLWLMRWKKRTVRKRQRICRKLLANYKQILISRNRELIEKYQF